MKALASLFYIINLTLIPSISMAQESVGNAVLSSSEIEEILVGFVKDFETDPFAREMVFGFEIDGQKWHFTMGKTQDGEFLSELVRGFPEQPILYWEFDSHTLQRLNQGMNGETATARAKADDPYPLRTRRSTNMPSFLSIMNWGRLLRNFDCISGRRDFRKHFR